MTQCASPVLFVTAFLQHSIPLSLMTQCVLQVSKTVLMTADVLMHGRHGGSVRPKAVLVRSSKEETA